jgi:hypothetical protein
LIRDLRAGLGPGVALIAMDGFADFAGLIAAAGPAATDMSVVNDGVPNSHLPATGGASCARSRPPARVGGRRGRRRAARPRTPASPDRSAAYTAQAAEILLDAIARSDGTRSSVTDELRRTRVEHGILGDIRFDHDGDVVKAPVTMFRIAGKRAVVDRVITVSAASRGRGETSVASTP